MPVTPRFSENAKINGPQYVVDNVQEVRVVVGMSDEDTYAEAIEKSIATFPYSGADILINPQVNGDVFLDFNGKSGIDPSGSAAEGEDSALIYIYPDNSEILKVFDVTDQAITDAPGNTVNTQMQRHIYRESTNIAT